MFIEKEEEIGYKADKPTLNTNVCHTAHLTTIDNELL
jgi:hypothetical protein